MRVGVNIFLTEYSIQPVQLGEELEARGYESLWVAEHSHIPTSRDTPWGGRKDAPPLPKEYRYTYDSFVALAAIAATTDRLKVGTGIALVAQRDPIWLAKEVASLDIISEGRFEFGIGFGWNREEMASHGVDARTRHRLVREKIALMKALWTEDRASYRGEMISMEESWAWPKPYQKPHPPIVMGSAGGPMALAAVAEYCDGWMPVHPQDLAGDIARLHALLEQAGRDPAEVEIGVYGTQPDPELWKGYEALGVSRVTIFLPPAPADVVVPLLDQHRHLVDN